MKRAVPDAENAISRKDFLRAFASLVAYSAPAVVALQQLGCSGGSGSVTAPDDGGSNCSYSGTSLSCSSVTVSTVSTP
jgi:hypothetical protein